MKTVIGIIGGGQLGKMIAQQAEKMAMEVVVLDPTPNCPAAAVSCCKQIVADFKDGQAIRQLAQSSDVVTYEIESGNTEILKELEQEGRKIFPSAETLRILQDKLRQKEFLKKNGIPVPEFIKVSLDETDETNNRYAQLTQIVSGFGFPSLLKLRKDAYDGRGNLAFKEERDLKQLMDGHFLNGSYSNAMYLLENFVPFVKEVSVMVTRNQAGQIAAFPVVENVHQEHILLTTFAPARISRSCAAEAKRVAIHAVESLKGVGIFGVELFVCAEEKVLVNEIAPRPHNSGHYTIEACDHSQFELHLRAILDLPLVEPKLLMPAVMLNILGCEGSAASAAGPLAKEDGALAYAVEGAHELLSVPGVHLHLYGKKGLRRKRKLGHITVMHSTLEGAIQKAEQVRNTIKIIPQK